MSTDQHGPFHWKVILAGVIVTVLGSVAAAVIIGEGRFAPRVAPTMFDERIASSSTATPWAASGKAATSPSVGTPQTSTTTRTPDTSEQTIETGTPEPTSPREPPETEEPTATPTLQARVVYEADWANGLNGWIGNDGWKTLPGSSILLNDGAGTTVLAPVALSDTPNYAVEAEIQVVKGLGCNAHFGLLIRASDQPLLEEAPGYMVGWVNMFCSAPPGFLGIAQGLDVSEPWNATWLQSTRPEPDADWHKYRVEVEANEIRVFYDRELVLQATSNSFLEGGNVGLWGTKTQFNVRSFRVLELDK